MDYGWCFTGLRHIVRYFMLSEDDSGNSQVQRVHRGMVVDFYSCRIVVSSLSSRRHLSLLCLWLTTRHDMTAEDEDATV